MRALKDLLLTKERNNSPSLTRSCHPAPLLPNLDLQGRGVERALSSSLVFCPEVPRALLNPKSSYALFWLKQGIQ